MKPDKTSITPTTRQRRYFAVAKRNADKSTYMRMNNGKIAIGAAIVNGNYVVSEGHNKRKTHTFQHTHNMRTLYLAPHPNLHAEIDALIYSRYNDLSGCEIFVYREMADGTLGNCRPCRACMSALKDAGIKHVYYTTEQGYHYERI
jgi:deoxycytidylate deaminase